MPSKDNPADHVSRGLIDANPGGKCSTWVNGPQFLWEPEHTWIIEKDVQMISDTDVEVKYSLKFNLTSSSVNIINSLKKISSCKRIKKIMAVIMKYKETWLNLAKKRKANTDDTIVDMNLLQKGETSVIRQYQREAFQKEISTLENGNTIFGQSSIFKLGPFLDNDGALRVSGRINKSNLDYRLKHPVLLPKEDHITHAIIRCCHEKVAHTGRGKTNEIRIHGYWIINCRSAVNSVISKCVEYRKLRRKICQQKMGSIPADRFSEEPPFTYCGVDMFGPFLVKDGRKIQKRYKAMFTCLSSRAVYIEVTSNLTADCFIKSLIRLISRLIRSDNATNFVGASIELKKAFGEMDEKRINDLLMELGGVWISWKRNPPMASNMGGVWEQQNHSARSIPLAMLRNHGESLSDESLHTLLVEVEGIINSRPITCESIGDVNSIIPLSPMQLVSSKTRVVMPSLGTFQKEDMYCRKQWWRVQHLSNEFWIRWRKEVFATLQSRQKWNQTK